MTIEKQAHVKDSKMRTGTGIKKYLYSLCKGTSVLGTSTEYL